MDPVLLILIGVAGFIIFRLISVMGTRTGHEQQHDLEALKQGAAARPEKSAPSEVEADKGAEEELAPPKPVTTHGRVIRDVDPEFDEDAFLDGARAAYEMIVEAFAAGDLRSIRPFLSEAVYEAFRGAVSARDEAGHQMDLKFVGIDRAAIIDSDVDEESVRATVAFTSNQVRVTRDAEGNVIENDPNRIDLVKDSWTFSRKRNSRDPNWILVGTADAA